MQRIIGTVCFLIFATSSIKAQKVRWILKPNHECKAIFIDYFGSLDGFFHLRYEDHTSEIVNGEGETIVQRIPNTYNDVFGRDVLNFYDYKKGRSLKFNKKGKELSLGYDRVNYAQFNIFITRKEDQLGLMDFERNDLAPNVYALLKRISLTEFKGIKDDESVDTITVPYDPKTYWYKELISDGINIKRENYFNKKNSKIEGTISMIYGRDTILHPNKYVTGIESIGDSLYEIRSINTELKGLISSSGRMLIPPIANSIKRTRMSKFFYVTSGSTKGIYDIIEDTLVAGDFSLTILNESFIKKTKNGNNTILDQNFNEVFTFDYEDVSYRKSYFIISISNKKYLYSNRKNEMSKDSFISVSPDKGNLVFVERDGKHGTYNASELKYIIAAEYDKIKRVSNSYIEGVNYSYDTLAIEPKPNSKNRTSKNRRKTKIKKLKAFSYFNDNGDLVFGPSDRNLTCADGDIFSFRHDSLMTFINLVTKEEYTLEGSGHTKSDRFIAYKYRQWVRPYELMKDGIDAPTYESVKLLSDNKTYLYEMNGLFGFMTYDKLITEPIYEEVVEKGSRHLTAKGERYQVKYKGKLGMLMIDY